MIRLSKSQVLLLHEQLVAETGGSPGLRDEGMLDSALNAPFQTFGGEDVYPSLQQKAALNGIELQYTQTELSDIILQLAAGTIQSSDLLNWVLTHQI